MESPKIEAEPQSNTQKIKTCKRKRYLYRFVLSPSPVDSGGSHIQFLDSMVIGDTGALARMEKEARRSSKAQKKINGMIRKKETKRGLRRVGGVCNAVRRKMERFSDTRLRATDNVRRFRRRLLRAKDAEGMHLFYVSEVGGTLEEGGWGVVVAPRSEKATTSLALQIATKDHGMRCAPSVPGLPLLDCSSDVSDILFKGCIPTFHSGVRALATFPDGFTPLFLLVTNIDASLSPQDASLDEHRYTSLQTHAIRLLGLREAESAALCIA